MKKALLVALAALTLIPTLAASDANARPGWRYYRHRPHYGPVYRPRWGPVLVMPPPVIYVEPPPVYYAPPPIYVEPPPVYVEPAPEPPPPRVVVVREEQRIVREPAPAPAPQVYERPPAPKEPEQRDFIAVGLHLSGVSVEGQKVGISTAENPSMGGVGIHLRGRFSESFGLELAVDFLEGSADDMDLTQSTIPLMAGLTWHILPTSRLQPYLVGGVGVHFTRLEYFGGDYNIDITELAGQLGGGVEFFLTENLAFHADLRLQTVFKNLDTKEKIATDCISQVGTQSGFCDNIHFTGEEDKVDLGVQLQAGVSWYF